MRWFAITACLLLVAGAWARGDAKDKPREKEKLPTIEEIRKAYGDGDYRLVIKEVAKLTANHDWRAKRPDAFELFDLKAQSHLHLKEMPPAASAFEQAGRESADKAPAATARVTALLIKKCTGSHYVPRATMNQRVAGGKPGDHVTIDIIDPDSRKAAIVALWEDEKKAADALLTPATSTDDKSVQHVIDAAPLIPHLRDYDIAAHGSDDTVRQLSANLAEHGRDLLTEMTDAMGRRVDAIGDKATAIDHLKQQGIDYYHKHGLEALEPSELKDIALKAQKIETALKILTDDLAPEEGFFAAVSKEAHRVEVKAQKLQKLDLGMYTTRQAAMED